jgi:CubicO group peptidase (beta-lactamase class C family)
MLHLPIKPLAWAALMTGSLLLSASAHAETVPACKTDLSGQLERLSVPGLAASVIKNGRIVCIATAGKSNIGENIPVTSDTLFLVASVSKTITVTALMQLYDQGKFQLDDDINKYLPFQIRIPGADETPITFRQLLTHTASIKDYSLSSYITKGSDSPIPLADFVKDYFTPGGKYYNADSNFQSGPPGTVSDYANMGIVLAGFLVETISGVPLDKYSRDNIFAPLGMNRTSWRLADINQSMLAMPYDDTPDGFKPFGHYGEANYPDGMLRTSVVELAHFLIAYMQDGAYEGQRILKEETVREMLKNQSPLDATQGLVWFTDTIGDRMVWGHNGSDYGASAQMWFDPVAKEGVIIMANGNWEDAEGLIQALFEEADDD